MNLFLKLSHMIGRYLYRTVLTPKYRHRIIADELAIDIDEGNLYQVSSSLANHALWA